VAKPEAPGLESFLRPEQLLDYLDSSPFDAASVIWTLSLDCTTIYAIEPTGAFAAEAYQKLRQFQRDQFKEGVERVSIPGVIDGQARLFNGQVVPIIRPEIRGMFDWKTKALVEAVLGHYPAVDSAGAEAHNEKVEGITKFLDRVYFELRNLGVAPQERAINFAATNAFNVNSIFELVLKEKEKLELDSIEVERSAVCRPDSDCWDVKLLFFFPERQVQTVRRAYRFTVDVSDVVPVTIGLVRSWFVR